MDVNRAARIFIKWCKDRGQFFHDHVSGGAYKAYSNSGRDVIDQAFLEGVKIGMGSSGLNSFVIEYNRQQYILFARDRDHALQKIKDARANFKACQIVEG